MRPTTWNKIDPLIWILALVVCAAVSWFLVVMVTSITI